MWCGDFKKLLIKTKFNQCFLNQQNAKKWGCTSKISQFINGVLYVAACFMNCYILFLCILGKGFGKHLGATFRYLVRLTWHYPNASAARDHGKAVLTHKTNKDQRPAYKAQANEYVHSASFQNSVAGIYPDNNPRLTPTRRNTNMSEQMNTFRVEKVKEHLENHGLLEAYREFDTSSATVELAAQTIGCEPGRIAKTLSLGAAQGPMVIVAMGTARLDNRKFKDTFQEKARFLKGEEVPELIGHPIGGVCPFALKDGVRVFLDESLRLFDPCYPAAGAPNNAVKLSLDELERSTGGVWIDVCRAE